MNYKNHVLAIALFLPIPALAQAPKTEVKCRPLASGDSIGPNESIVGSGSNAQVCAVVAIKAAPQPEALKPSSTPYTPAPAVTTEKHEKPVVFLNGSGSTQTTTSRGLFGTANTNSYGEVLITDTAHGMHQSIKNKSEKFCTAILADWDKKQQTKMKP